MPRHLVRLFGALLVATIVSSVGPTSAASAQGSPFCNPGQTPGFLFGFGQLRAQLGPLMGEPLECEHPDSASGDTLQQTTTGLAFYRRATNTPTFTDGWRHWGLTPDGLVTWEGESIDPPLAQVRPIPRPPGPLPVPAPAPAPREPRIDDRLLLAWRELMSLEIGAPARNTLTSQNVSVHIGNLGPPQFLAAYSPNDRLIVFNRSTIQGEGPRALAAVLAHEITHVAQVAEDRFGPGEHGCLAKESEAVLVEVRTWEAFWGGLGPETTRLELALNERLRIFRRNGADGIANYVRSSAGWRAQCSRHAA